MVVHDGGVVEDQEGSSSPCPDVTAAAEAEAEAAAAIARAARPPRPGRDKRLGVRHPLKHRRFRAGGKMMAEAGRVSSSAQSLAGAREVGEATTVAEATAMGVGSDGEDEARYICGGWKSEDGIMSCGYSSFRGRRASMEDFYDIKSSKVDDKQINLFGVFDGHGGSHAAEYLKGHLFENLLKHPAFVTDTKSAISETYRKTDSDFLDAETNVNREDGSTASTAILVGNHLYVANVGDSRTVMSKAGKAIALSDDHKPNRKDEQKRIESAGGVVTWSGTWRVGGVLAMSRAFGNRLLKRFVVAEPEIQEQEIDDDMEFLILASDGLWDVVSNEHAVAFVKAEEGPEAAARKLAEIAFARGSTDNITCIVVKFGQEEKTVDSASSGEQS
uniref:protein-serine/threonine phosphatase n=1 Tax=Leersia perrieri TaxID=77586 RepID=A0A0D9V2Y9_9ORYZ